VLYAALYLLALVAAFWFVVPQVFNHAVGHPGPLCDYFQLAWSTCSLAMIGGALGAALETEDAVYDAAYVRRSDAQRKWKGSDSATDAVPAAWCPKSCAVLLPQRGRKCYIKPMPQGID
jgi:hypothetical protein